MPLLAAAMALAGCTAHVHAGRATAYPEAALVDVLRDGQLGAYCSGALIAPSVVLTAGHCTVPLITQGGSVVFGPTLDGSIATIPIARAVAHPQFDLATLTNDVGVLVLASSAPVAPRTRR